jgi:hypothetical protein
MVEKKDEKQLLPPYLPYRTFENLLQGLKSNGIPARIDRSVVSSFSGTMQAILLNALKYLNLINETGTPLETLQKLVSLEGIERQKFIQELIKDRYRYIFKDNIALDKITPDQLREFFEMVGTSGDTTKKSIRFFVEFAKDGGMNLSPHLKKSRATGARKRGRAAKEDTEHTDSEEESKIEIKPQESTVSPTWYSLLLEKFPALDPAWPDDVKAKWFDSFNKLMEHKK